MPAYDNTAIAAKLDLYADLLELSGADRYRFLSYRKASSALRAWPEQADTLSAENRLTDIPSVGAKMAGLIAQILATGTFADLDELSARVPPGLARVMQVPGVGPRRAMQLHDKLGVQSVDDLEAALADGRVERLGGFGSKTAEKIAASITSVKRHAERRTLAEALPVAEALQRDLTALPAVEEAVIAGSVRRRQETVGNIDLVVSARDLPSALEQAESLPAVERVLERGPDLLTLELHDGMRVDVRFVAPGILGSATAHWTGSIAFNEALAALPITQIPAEDERAYFESIGLPYLPPEIRDDAGIIVAARSGSVPDVISLDDVLGDLQSHSTFTDGKSSLEANRAVAAELGYQYIAATDHAYNLRMVGGLELESLERQWAEIDELNARGDGPRILKGIELNVADDGSVDYDDEVLARFEIVLASLHSGWDQDAATVTRRMLRAIQHPLVDIVAHPTGRILGRRDPMALDMDEVLAAAGETGTIMEINSYPDRLDLSDRHIKLARTYGVRFSLGTDAHAANQLRYMPFGVAQARRGLVTADELINAQPWHIARTWLKRARSANSP